VVNWVLAIIHTDTDFAFLRDDIEMISAGTAFTFIKKSNGELFVFGDNHSGQLGLKNEPQKWKYNSPVLVMKDERIKAIALGNEHSIILMKDGELLGSGSNTFGQLGLNEFKYYYQFTLIRYDEQIKQIYAGMCHTLILSKSGEIFGLGSSEFGELGFLNSKPHNSIKIEINEKINMLIGQSQQAWSFSNHSEFSQHFQQLIITFLLCQRRFSKFYRLPKPIFQLIINLAL